MDVAEPLPSEVDAVVIGTGLTESILAAAFARVGLSVLHLDGNEFYGAAWASFNLEGLQRWADDELERSGRAEATRTSERDDRVRLPVDAACWRNLTTRWHVERRPPAEAATQLPAEEEEESVGAVCASDDDDSNAASSTAHWRETLEADWRKFSLDLSPKVLYSRGAMVQLMINCGVSRYAEFKAVGRLLCEVDGRLDVVPCSRADIFQNDRFSLLQKRTLMKFLTDCLNFEPDGELFRDNSDGTFAQLLQDRGISDNLKTFVEKTLAAAPQGCSALDALARVKQFLLSVGRYDNSPFLFALYGAGELPQCFCRLCAVFGGVYCLNRRVDALLLDGAGSRLVAVESGGERIECRCLVANVASWPSARPRSRRVQRALLIADASVRRDDERQISLWHHDDGGDALVAVLEVAESALVCPKGFYIVHLTSEGDASAVERLWPVIRRYWSLADDEAARVVDGSKPTVLFSCLFDVNSFDEVVDGVPENVALTSPPDCAIGYDSAVEQAKCIFMRLRPEDEFLAQAPTTPDEMDAGLDAGIDGFAPQTAPLDHTPPAPDDNQYMS